MWQSVCSSYCCQLNTVSFSTPLHAALYRSIYIVLTWSSLGTLQGFLVCYCECGSPSVPVTAVSLMLSVSAQHFIPHCIRSIYSLLTWSYLGTLLGFVGTFAKFRIATVSFVMSDSPSFHLHGTTRLPLDRLS